MANGILTSEFGTDFNFYQNVSSLDIDYCSLDKVRLSISNPVDNSFLVLHIIIRNLNKTLENFLISPN